MNAIYHDLVIYVPKCKVFQAIATNDGMNNWWTLKCKGEFKKGEIINLNFTDEYNWYAKIEDYSKDNCIEFSMINAKEEWLPTRFGFGLKEDKPNNTTVEFYHKNWTAINKEYRVASFCWAMLLSQLKNYLENGIITPFEKRN